MAQCEMCGKNTQLFSVQIEVTSMNVCKPCSAFGKIVKTVPQSRTVTRASRPEFVPVSNVSKRVREIRERHKLTQSEFASCIGERESLIPKIESGALTPSLVVLRKIEQRYAVTLTEEDTVFEYARTTKKQTGFTVGDFIKIKK